MLFLKRLIIGRAMTRNGVPIDLDKVARQTPASVSQSGDSRQSSLV